MADLNGAGGWIKLNRKIWNNFIWDFETPKYTLAWIDILLQANFQDKKIMFDGKSKVVKQGSFVTSMVKLSSRWNMSRRTVKNFLDTLQESGMITYESTKRCTTVFVTNYLAYQGFAGSGAVDEYTTDGATHGTADGATDGATHGTQHKKVKNLKQGKEGKEPNTPQPSKADVDSFFETIWKLYPVKKGKGSVSDSKKKALYAIGLDEMKRAIDRYLHELKKDADWRKPQHGSTFFNSGYVDYLDNNFVPDEAKGVGSNGSAAGDTGKTQRIGRYV